MKRLFARFNIGFVGAIFMLVSIGFAQKAEAKPKHPLVGVWRLETTKGDRPQVCYKLLNKNGTYVNLKSLDKNGECFYVSRHGKFSAGTGEYTEFLMEENGEKCFPPYPFPLKYEFLNKNTVKISFVLQGQQYEETWHKAKKAPQY